MKILQLGLGIFCFMVATLCLLVAIYHYKAKRYGWFYIQIIMSFANIVCGIVNFINFN